MRSVCARVVELLRISVNYTAIKILSVAQQCFMENLCHRQKETYVVFM
jgi:hypothetical protein